MTQEMQSHDLKLTKTLKAPVQRVWQALTRGEEIAGWFGPDDAFRIEVLEWDCRVGGAYRVAMHDPEGNTHTCFGLFREVDEPHRLAYTWAWEGAPPMDTLVVFELADEGTNTALRFRHSGFPAAEVRDEHEMGWTGSLERLSRAVV